MIGQGADSPKPNGRQGLYQMCDLASEIFIKKRYRSLINNVSQKRKIIK